MTTIAWDGRQLAADKQCTIFKGKTKKIHRLPDGRLFGSAGDLRDVFSVKEWLMNGGEKPKVSERFHGIVVEGGHLLVMEDNLALIEYEEQPFFAIGSGREYAMTAMHLGKSAKEAVLIAHIFDTGTGSEVDVLVDRIRPGNACDLPPSYPSEPEEPVFPRAQAFDVPGGTGPSSPFPTPASPAND